MWRSALFWAGGAVLLPQAWWVRARALRLPPGAGPLTGKEGAGDECRLLVIGDSIAIGVGAARLEEALPGHLARALAGLLRRQVCWTACGRNGAAAGEVIDSLPALLPAQPVDLVLVSVGVNDVTGLTRVASWEARLRTLSARLRAHSPHALIAFLGVAPMGAFPALPQPLRWLLGLRAATLDRAAARTLASLPQVLYLAFEEVPDPGRFSADGYHPSAQGYRELGEALAVRIAPHLGEYR